MEKVEMGGETETSDSCWWLAWLVVLVQLLRLSPQANTNWETDPRAGNRPR
jgi:hypothetical protein